MGKTVNTDDVSRSLDTIIAMGAATGKKLDDEAARAVKSVLEAVLYMTPESAPVYEKTELHDDYDIGKRLRIRTCAKCLNEILSVKGTDDYSFCPICGRKIVKGTFKM